MGTFPVGYELLWLLQMCVRCWLQIQPKQEIADLEIAEINVFLYLNKLYHLIVDMRHSVPKAVRLQRKPPLTWGRGGGDGDFELFPHHFYIYFYQFYGNIEVIRL